jgi:hypothetical protein
MISLQGAGEISLLTELSAFLGGLLLERYRPYGAFLFSAANHDLTPRCWRDIAPSGALLPFLDGFLERYRPYGAGYFARCDIGLNSYFSKDIAPTGLSYSLLRIMISLQGAGEISLLAELSSLSWADF